MISGKGFQKFVVLQPNVFEKFKSTSVPNDHLSNVEKNIIAVLKNKQLSTLQRFRYYTQLLNRSNKNNISSKPDTTKISHPVSSDASTQTTFENNVKTKNAMVNTDPPLSEEEIFEDTKNTLFDSIDQSGFNLLDSSTSTDGFDATIIPAPKFLQTPSRIASSLKKKRILTPFRQSSTPIRPKPTIRKTLNIEEEEEFDIEGVQKEFLDEATRQSGGPLDLTKLLFKHLDNPESSYVSNRNPATNEEFSVGKSDAMVKRQKKFAAVRTSPYNTRENPKQTERLQMDEFGNWVPLEKILFKKKI